jgi:cell division protein FtsZ
MSEMGKAMMGTGEAEGDRRAIDAAEAAISNPLLEDVSMKGARGVLINITGGLDMTLFEVDEAANRIREEVDPDANIIFGSTFDEMLEGRMRISVVATGIEADKAVQPRPLISLVSDRSKADAPRTLTPFSPSPSPAAELKPLEQRISEMRAEPRPMAAEPRFEMKAEPVAPALPQAQSIEAQAVRNTPFIPPKPVETAPKPVPAAVAAPVPEPVMAAPQVEAVRPAAAAATAKPASRGPSLFERVTKAGRLLHREEPEISRVTPVVNAAPVAAPTPAPTPVAAPAPAPAPTAQAKLGPLDPAERPGSKEEDLLDIPAFLRRQAN